MPRSPANKSLGIKLKSQTRAVVFTSWVCMRENTRMLRLVVNVTDVTASFPPLTFSLAWIRTLNTSTLQLLYLRILVYFVCKHKLVESFVKTIHDRERFMVFAVTHSDKHVREGSSGVFRHIDGRDDPVSLLSPQRVGRGASLMSSRKFDNSGLWVPHSWQHFFKAELKREKPYVSYQATSWAELH